MAIRIALRVSLSGPGCMPPAASKDRLPISVVVPTLNVMPMLPEHVAGMRDWLDLVEEVVVVDSESTDGTREYLEQHIDQGQLRFFSRPRGLYQAWNYGIDQVRAPYTYISTVGDTISREGLQHLHAVAAGLDAGVVISPPRFIDEAGRPIATPVWPIHRLLRLFSADQPRLLERWVAFGLGLTTMPQAILGSSASNLYRSDCLKRSHFPLEFGMAGDTAWGVANALRVPVAMTGRVISDFRFHEKSYNVAPFPIDDMQERLESLAGDALDEALAGDARLRSAPETGLLQAMLEQRRAARLHRIELSAIRRKAPPWYLRSAAWRALAQRNRARREYRRYALQLLARSCGRTRAWSALRNMKR